MFQFYKNIRHSSVSGSSREGPRYLNPNKTDCAEANKHMNLKMTARYVLGKPSTLFIRRTNNIYEKRHSPKFQSDKIQVTLGSKVSTYFQAVIRERNKDKPEKMCANTSKRTAIAMLQEEPSGTHKSNARRLSSVSSS